MNTNFEGLKVDDRASVLRLQPEQGGVSRSGFGVCRYREHHLGLSFGHDGVGIPFHEAVKLGCKSSIGCRWLYNWNK